MTFEFASTALEALEHHVKHRPVWSFVGQHIGFNAFGKSNRVDLSLVLLSKVCH